MQKGKSLTRAALFCQRHHTRVSPTLIVVYYRVHAAKNSNEMRRLVVVSGCNLMWLGWNSATVTSINDFPTAMFVNELANCIIDANFSPIFAVCYARNNKQYCSMRPHSLSLYTYRFPSPTRRWQKVLFTSKVILWSASLGSMQRDFWLFNVFRFTISLLPDICARWFKFIVAHWYK